MSPFYSFRCTQGHVFEDMQSVSAENPLCPISIDQMLPDGTEVLCRRSTVKIPVLPSPAQGLPTQKFYPGR